MNVLFTNFHPGNGGGHTTYLTYLFKDILSDNDDINPYIAVPKTSKLNLDLKFLYPTRVFDVDFPGKPKEIIQALLNARKLKKIIIENNIDLIHVNGTPDHKVVMLCRWLYGLSYKIIRTKHDTFPIKKGLYANKLYGRYTDHMIVVSQYLFDEVITKELQEKTSVIHNGIDLNFFAKKEKSKHLMEKYNVGIDNLVFVSVAGTGLHKGWQFLIKAASNLEDIKRHRIKIIIAGNYPKDKIITKFVHDLNMSQQVIFTGLINDVRDLISIADVGFVLSKYEALSIACKEMMAMGKPMLISNVGGLPENIDINVNGWSTDPEDIGKLHKLIDSLFSINLEPYSKSAKSKASNNFGLKKFKNKTIEAYRKLI